MRKLLVGVAFLALAAAACGSEPAELSGFVRTPLPNVGATTLPDAGAGGANFQMQASTDEILVVYFGYTACPDVCPTTMADLKSALRDIGDDSERIEVAMATVDPDRDTDDVITGYVQSFVPDAHGLRTDDDDALRAVADVFGADYDVTVTDDGAYEVIHTAHLYAIDDAGLIQVTWAFGTESETIAQDLQILLDAQ